MKKILSGIVALSLFLAVATVAKAGQGTPEGNGWTPWADVYVTWNGDTSVQGDWWVDKNMDGDVVDDNYGCDNCVGVDYDFVFKGKTLQFDEVYVDAVEAHPQSHHVVLNDSDGDGVYEGSITARYDYEASLACPTRMDVIEYTVDTNLEGQDGFFKYVENEYCLAQ